jgi:hypothetical protein
MRPFVKILLQEEIMYQEKYSYKIGRPLKISFKGENCLAL